MNYSPQFLSEPLLVQHPMLSHCIKHTQVVIVSHEAHEMAAGHEQDRVAVDCSARTLEERFELGVGQSERRTAKNSNDNPGVSMCHHLVA
jgi:hypothetical protein